MNEWENENEWKKMIERISEKINKWMNEWMNKWMNEWINEGMIGWMEEGIIDSTNQINDRSISKIKKKCLFS